MADPDFGEPVSSEESGEEDTNSDIEGFDSLDEEDYDSGEWSPPPSPQAKRSRIKTTSTKSPQTPHWKTDRDPDTAPPDSTFQPARRSGPQLDPSSTHTPLDLFKLFFTSETIQTLCRNTDKQAAKNIARGKKYKWTDLTLKEFYKYLGLVFYMSMVRLTSIADYWRQNHVFSLPLPSKIMSRDRFLTISWNLHISDPDEDVRNDRKKGTPKYDPLFRVKPLLGVIKTASKACYHPHRNLAVHERMVASRANVMQAECAKAKPSKFGFKLFVLADCRQGYTVDFNIYTGRAEIPHGHALSYDVVMSLVRQKYLGKGYHVYLDSFYTCPKLFRALQANGFLACGPYRERTKDCPKTSENALTEESERGSIRWIREDQMLFVKWMDTKPVSMCSTIHAANSDLGNSVQRRDKNKDGRWTSVSVPCPTPVSEYNTHMGAIDTSDQLIQYYTGQHKTMRWYRKLFFHFLDVATTNSYILHKELCEKQDTTKPLTHKAFMEELTAGLLDIPLDLTPAPTRAGHMPVVIADPSKKGSSSKATIGRKWCAMCKRSKQRKDTPWKCNDCDVALCLRQDRNCFAMWHGIGEGGLECVHEITVTI